MPQAEGGYVSLPNGQNATVYKSTTEPAGSQTMLESVKRVIGNAIGVNGTGEILVPPRGGQPIIVNAR